MDYRKRYIEIGRRVLGHRVIGVNILVRPPYLLPYPRHSSFSSGRRNSSCRESVHSRWKISMVRAPDITPRHIIPRHVALKRHRMQPAASPTRHSSPSFSRNWVVLMVPGSGKYKIVFSVCARRQTFFSPHFFRLISSTQPVESSRQSPFLSFFDVGLDPVLSRSGELSGHDAPRGGGGGGLWWSATRSAQASIAAMRRFFSQ